MHSTSKNAEIRRISLEYPLENQPSLPTSVPGFVHDLCVFISIGLFCEHLYSPTRAVCLGRNQFIGLPSFDECNVSSLSPLLFLSTTMRLYLTHMACTLHKFSYETV